MSGGGGGGGSRRESVTPVSPGGRGSSGSDGGQGANSNPCVLVEETVLNSPVPAVVASLGIGDILRVDLEKGPPVRVMIRTGAGQTAGAITGAKLPQIIACIEAGVEYAATVVSVKGGAVRIRVANI